MDARVYWWSISTNKFHFQAILFFEGKTHSFSGLSFPCLALPQAFAETELFSA